MTKRILQLTLLTLCLVHTTAEGQQVYDFDMTRPMPRYTDSIGYGYDVVEGNQYFSVKVPEGHYKVTVVLGAKKHAATTMVKAEDRRLFVDAVSTKKGEFKTFEFTINRRSPKIDEKQKVSIDPRELRGLNWDDKLTLEFVGDLPAVKSLHIEPAPDSIPVIYLCGNSTVTDQWREPWASWGQMVTRWFDSGVSVVNLAKSGLTAGSFLRQHRLEKALATLKPGDIVVCEFGHNDQKEHRPGDGPWYNYVHNLKVYVDEVRAKDATLVFATPTRRRRFDKEGHVINSHGDYPAAMKAVAERENIPVIDLQEMTKTFYEAMGVEESKHALCHYPIRTWPGQEKELADNTHFNAFGAYEVSKMIVMGMKQLGLPIVNHLRDDWQDFSPNSPDDWQQWKWYPSALSDVTKPAGN